MYFSVFRRNKGLNQQLLFIATKQQSLKILKKYFVIDKQPSELCKVAHWLQTIEQHFGATALALTVSLALFTSSLNKLCTYNRWHSMPKGYDILALKTVSEEEEHSICLPIKWFCPLAPSTGKLPHHFFSFLAKEFSSEELYRCAHLTERYLSPSL